MMLLNRRTLSRRRLLRGAGGAAIALPLLQIMTRTRAAQAAEPKRFVVVYFPEGTAKQGYWPGSSFDLTTPLKPLEPYKSQLILVKGVNHNSVAGETGSGDAHNKYPYHMLTGGHVNSDTGGYSLDQWIAKEIGKGTAFPSLVYGVNSVTPQGGNKWISYQGPYKAPGYKVLAEDSAARMFAKMFMGGGAGPVDTGALMRLSAERKSVLDAIKGDLDELKATVGSDDKKRLDAHLTALRSVERQIFGNTPAGSPAAPAPTCARPASYTDGGDMPGNSAKQLELAALALECGLTNVVAVQYGATLNEIKYGWVGVNSGHHTISHAQDGDAKFSAQVKIYTWYNQQLAVLLKRLSGSKLPDGSSLLDQSLVMNTSEFGHGDHSGKDIPILLAGKLQGAFKTGRYLQLGGVNHNDLLLTIAQAYGSAVTTFGDKQYSKGPIAQLRG